MIRETALRRFGLVEISRLAIPFVNEMNCVVLILARSSDFFLSGAASENKAAYIQYIGLLGGWK